MPVKVARTSEIPPGKGIKVKVGKKSIALFNFKGDYFAIQNTCPHQNADLADGYIRDGKIFCPMHNWAFDLISGAFAFNDNLKLKTYPVQVRGNDILISI